MREIRESNKREKGYPKSCFSCVRNIESSGNILRSFIFYYTQKRENNNMTPETFRTEYYTANNNGTAARGSMDIPKQKSFSFVK